MSMNAEPLSPSVACDGWTYCVLPTVDSTNTYAARLPAWSAVRAETQTAGRGRTRDRRWISDTGGLWLSAVLPCPGSRATWEILPLAAGWAVIEALEEVGVPGPRLRWPNDVMVRRAKLAGLLVERFTPDTAVVGIGLNVSNDPEGADSALVGQTARLEDLVPGTCRVDHVARQILRMLRRAHGIILESGFSPIAAELNASWREPRRVEVTFAGEARPVAGTFHGIDERGRIKLETAGGATAFYSATQINLLRELD